MPRPVTAHCVIKPARTHVGQIARTIHEYQQGGGSTGFKMTRSHSQITNDIRSTK